MMWKSRLLVIFVLFFSNCHEPTQRFNELLELSKGKPDLVIEGVEYERISTIHRGYPSGVIGGGPNYRFSVIIKNIGDGELAQPFYLSSTLSEADYKNGKMNTSLQNYNWYPLILLPGDRMVCEKFLDIKRGTTKIFFVVNARQGKDESRKKNAVEETNYENNTYIFEFSK